MKDNTTPCSTIYNDYLSAENNLHHFNVISNSITDYGLIYNYYGGTYGIVKITDTVIRGNYLNSKSVFEGVGGPILVAGNVFVDTIATHGSVTLNGYFIANDAQETTYMFYESGLCDAIIPYPMRTTPPMTPNETPIQTPQETQKQDPVQDPTEESTTNSKIISSGESNQNSSQGSKLILGFLTQKQFYICIGIICGLVLIILVLIFVIHRLRNKSETNSISEYSYSMPEEQAQPTEPFNSTNSNTHENPLFIKSEQPDDVFANDFEDVSFNDFNSDSTKASDIEDSAPEITKKPSNDQDATDEAPNKVYI
ncbi:hypothetical protein TVAG_383680 [Trichomonas vaginalis G3]|uniref:Uncharacterized protein n=1 Tax=Trichomonas vaginalis (strain ATCC PRA-98 / G3) TaxID=412133 RepID=A2EZ77_TRIV3|nr:bifunctional inhibitor/lipid-transfer protein/seed storage 2s albumin superfamily protein family [Trichomonas vaginalis G3]EAY02065.1 hypothetical protein TVAG_383680 [Trichomonas vaginalis G3]KAI5514295.1 bifunctional inhibitor/lipid-transfer protein/seed storage 2s albumin superfamily protein family [Trichomonas vaginalis G3]|eukprot:XP_001330519.1 hypothetical protein [Trichomonas vaginalis G3]